MITETHKYIMPEPNTGCWIWTSNKSQKGYGIISIMGKKHRAHRVSYLEAYGTIPEGLVLDHTCRNRLCCNPKHLRAVTSKENILCGEGLAAMNAKKTHCKRGHPLHGDNLRVKIRSNRAPERVCRQCHREHHG